MTDAQLPLAPPPASIHQWTGFRFGRYNGPLEHPDIKAEGLLRFRLKEWHYLSVVTDDWFVAVAVVQAGYAAQLFAYVVNRHLPARPWETERVSPLGRALSFAPSSVGGTTRWESGDEHVTIAARDGWEVDLALTVDGRRLEGRFHVDPAPGLSIVFPLAPRQPAYTHKAAGMRAEGELRFGNDAVLAKGASAFAVSDWTRSLAERTTRWKWASFAGHDTQGREVGLNLSAEVYDDQAGNSQENALFVNGEATFLDGVRFTLPSRPRVEAWEVKSRNGRDVDLRFVPLGARAQNLNLGVLRTRFVQPYGTFHGRVREHRVDGIFGVVEDHLSVW